MRENKGGLAETELQQAVALHDAVNQDAESEIDLLELFYRLMENIWYIVGAAVAAAVLVGIYSFFIAHPIYESTAKIYVITKDSALNLQDLQIGSQLTNDYQELFKVREVNEEVILRLGLPYTVDELGERITLSNPANTRILYIAARSEDPIEAMNIANSFSEIVRQTVKERFKSEEPTVLSEAQQSLIPISPNKTRNTLVGAVVGAFLAIGVIFLLFVMDDKLKSSDDLAKYIGLPTLAVMPMLGATHTHHPYYMSHKAKTVSIDRAKDSKGGKAGVA
ncbi:MAG: polysaccharide export protein [Oscillospiraceae bacterium]|jgi:capsular polysaccharide biosynthesis protein|nr:polysaccharide export protein [Oscillospiraceae bacterium]